MIYGGDTMLAMPVMQLYDKDIMRMAVENARYMYEKADLRIKDFNKEYGDFTSPILKDMDWYNENVTGRVQSTINDLYARGIDPLRNPEGRAAVLRLIYSMPTGSIAKLRLSAETAREYLKSFDDNTNPELERFLGRNLDQWSTLGDEINGIRANGVWGYNKASKYQTIDDLIEPIVKNVDYTYDEAMTRSHNDGNNYYSITRDRLMLAVNDNMADILATPSGRFHWEQAKMAAAARGGDETLARLIFDNMIGNRLSDHERVKFEADPFKLDDYRTRNDIRAHSAKAAIDYKYKHKDDPESENGYNVPEDVYITSLAKAAGLEYLPKSGLNPDTLNGLLLTAIKKQKEAINRAHNVLDATGAFISPEKISGLIQADGKDEDGYFLNQAYFKNLHDLSDVASSYKNWRKRGTTAEKSTELRKSNVNRSKEIVDAAKDYMKENNKGNNYYRVRVVPTIDKNGNNTYSMVGEDNKWHTYALMRMYVTDGKTTKDVGIQRLQTNVSEDGTRTKPYKEYDIPATGRLVGIEIGLHSNKGTGIPDLSLTSREELGGYGYFATDKWVSRALNSGFGFGDRIMDKDAGIQQTQTKGN